MKTGLLIEIHGLHWENIPEEKQKFYDELQERLKIMLNEQPEIRGYLSTASVTKVDLLDDIHHVRRKRILARGIYE